MSFTPRKLQTVTLVRAAERYAGEFPKATQKNRNTGRSIAGQGFVIEDLYRLTFRDVFDFIVAKVEDNLDQDNLEKFRRACADRFEPRRDDVFEKLLEEKLAINPAGEHILGKIGTTKIGSRVVGRYTKEIPKYDRPRFRDRLLFRSHGPLREMRLVAKRAYWPVYAGEIEEREAGSTAPDKLPEGAEPFTTMPETFMANSPRISAESAIAACDAIVDRLDEGSTAATIRGRTGTQPADPDATETGTLLFTLTMQSTAFNAASDASPGGIATAATITSDTSADATGTIGYCRAGATGTGADDHIDGSAGVSSGTFDFEFNTDAFVAGAAVTMTSFTVLMPQS